MMSTTFVIVTKREETYPELFEKEMWLKLKPNSLLTHRVGVLEMPIYTVAKEFEAEPGEQAKSVFEFYKTNVKERLGVYCSRCGFYYKHSLHFHR